MTETTPRKRAPRKPRTPEATVIPVVRRKIAELVPDPGNARRHSEHQLAMLQASLRRFGQPKPILIDSKDVVVAGNGIMEAALREGWEWIETRTYPGSPQEARAYAIADNRLGELSDWDMDVLTDTLGTLDETMRLDLGWTPDELDKLLSDDGDAGSGGHGPELPDMEYRIIVECRDEGQQRELLEKFEAEGLDCRAVMS